MVTTRSKTITLDDFLRLPETKPASEYIDGQIIPKLMQGKRIKTLRSLSLYQLTISD